MTGRRLRSNGLISGPSSPRWCGMNAGRGPECRSNGDSKPSQTILCRPSYPNLGRSVGQLADGQIHNAGMARRRASCAAGFAVRCADPRCSGALVKREHLMRSTTYQCDQCRDVLVQGIAIAARYFTPAGCPTRVALDRALEVYAQERHFCDTDCMATYLRLRTGD